MTPTHPASYPVARNNTPFSFRTPLMQQPVLILLAATLLAAPATADVPRDGWYRSLGEARQAARQSQRPLMIVFRCET